MSTALFHGDLVTTQRVLYTPSLFARTNLLYVQEIGRLQAQRPHASKRENLSSYLFFMVISGSGTLSYDEKTYCVNAGDCVFIDCRHPYCHESSTDLWQLQWVHFNGSTAAGIYEKYVERGGQPCFHVSDLTQYQAVLDQLYNLATGEDYIRDMRINERLSTLFTLLMEESWHPETQRTGTKKQNLLAIKLYLEEHFTEKITLDDLSERFFINKFYLTRVFKEQFGLSVNQFLLQKRITHAKQLLRFTDKTIEAIGLECGMGAAHYFSRMFKNVEGIGPREYRKMW